MTMPISPEARANLSQTLAKAADHTDQLVKMWRTTVERLGEAEATMILYIALSAVPPTKVIDTAIAAIARLGRTEVTTP